MQAGVTMRERGATTPRPLTIKNIGGVPMARATVTQDRLKEALSYDPDTGVFTWAYRVSTHCYAGDVAGSKSSLGYTRITLDGKEHLAHRLAWLYVNGELPKGDLDHINRDKSDNRIANLREASSELNNRNRGVHRRNKTMVSGVRWSKQAGKWQVTLSAKHLGYFTDFFEACCARKSAENKFWQQN